MFQIRIRIINNTLKTLHLVLDYITKKRIIFTMMFFYYSYNSNYEGEYQLIEPEIIINLSSDGVKPL